MFGYIGGKFNTLRVKQIASLPANPSKYNLPKASILIVINNPDNGLPLPIMDGTLISAMRTGASAGVAAHHFAKKDSEIIRLIGAGAKRDTGNDYICY